MFSKAYFTFKAWLTYLSVRLKYIKDICMPIISLLNIKLYWHRFLKYLPIIYNYFFI